MIHMIVVVLESSVSTEDSRYVHTDITNMIVVLLKPLVSTIEQ